MCHYMNVFISIAVSQPVTALSTTVLKPKPKDGRLFWSPFKFKRSVKKLRFLLKLTEKLGFSHKFKIVEPII